MIHLKYFKIHTIVCAAGQVLILTSVNKMADLNKTAQTQVLCCLGEKSF